MIIVKATLYEYICFLITQLMEFRLFPIFYYKQCCNKNNFETCLYRYVCFFRINSCSEINESKRIHILNLKPSALYNRNFIPPWVGISCIADKIEQLFPEMLATCTCFCMDYLLRSISLVGIHNLLINLKNFFEIINCYLVLEVFFILFLLCSFFYTFGFWVTVKSLFTSQIGRPFSYWIIFPPLKSHFYYSQKWEAFLDFILFQWSSYSWTNKALL